MGLGEKIEAADRAGVWLPRDSACGGGLCRRQPPPHCRAQARWAPGWPFRTTKDASTTAGEVVSAADATTR